MTKSVKQQITSTDNIYVNYGKQTIPIKLYKKSDILSKEFNVNPLASKDVFTKLKDHSISL